MGIVAEIRENSKLTIMHLGKFYWPVRGGIETALRQISEAGTRLGHQVICWVAQQDQEPTEDEVIDQVKVKRFSSLGIFFSVPMSFGFFFSKKPDYSILHVHLPHPLAELYTIFFVTNRKVKIMPYLHAFPVGHGFIGRLWFKLITDRILRSSHSILISNPEMMNIIPSLRQYSKKVIVLPFSTETISEAERAELLPSREENKIILTVGRSVPYKGHQDLLVAWKELLLTDEKAKTWKLVLVGDGPELENLKKWADENLPRENILLTGACNDEEKKNWLKKSTVFVLSSVSTAETFGISLLEAFGMGLPAIVSNLPGGVSTLARNGACGRIYELEKKNALSEALQFMIESEEVRKQSGQNNLAFAEENFSNNSLLKIYEKTLNGK